ncbi:MAG: hypothetical protein ACTSRU_04835 [Candidatus Hodarchaeales archaeon]
MIDYVVVMTAMFVIMMIMLREVIYAHYNGYCKGTMDMMNIHDGRIQDFFNDYFSADACEGGCGSGDIITCPLCSINFCRSCFDNPDHHDCIPSKRSE